MHFYDFFYDFFMGFECTFARTRAKKKRKEESGKRGGKKCIFLERKDGQTGFCHFSRRTNGVLSLDVLREQKKKKRLLLLLSALASWLAGWYFLNERKSFLGKK